MLVDQQLVGILLSYYTMTWPETVIGNFKISSSFYFDVKGSIYNKIYLSTLTLVPCTSLYLLHSWQSLAVFYKIKGLSNIWLYTKIINKSILIFNSTIVTRCYLRRSAFWYPFLRWLYSTLWFPKLSTCSYSVPSNLFPTTAGGWVVTNIGLDR